MDLLNCSSRPIDEITDGIIRIGRWLVESDVVILIHLKVWIMWHGLWIVIINNCCQLALFNIER